MTRSTKTVTVSLPAEMMTQVEEAMAEEGQTRSGLLREALRRYLAAREWRKLQAYATTKAKEKGITEGQVEDIVDAYRG
ncbi:MAG: ribbon-helix-helix protein, CopG family [Chloroflexi bacterium]|nr:ribbon-helix-helix protein, CopG family [Chloroflexota bacterium]